MTTPLPDDDVSLLLAVKGSLQLLLVRAALPEPIRQGSPELSAHVARLGKALVAALDAMLCDPGPAAAVPPGRYFSDTEQAIWDALAAGPLRGAEVARAIRYDYNGGLRAIFSNMVGRGVLLRTVKGYKRAESPRRASIPEKSSGRSK
jgi:hypothetical protein